LAKKVAFIMGVVFSGLYNWENCHKMAGWRSESAILLPLDLWCQAVNHAIELVFGTKQVDVVEVDEPLFKNIVE
jgi:hypothetical protein